MNERRRARGRSARQGADDRLVVLEPRDALPHFVAGMDTCSAPLVIDVRTRGATTPWPYVSANSIAQD